MIGKVLGRIEHPLEALSARGRCWFARPVSRADHFVPGAFVVGSDRLLDFRSRTTRNLQRCMLPPEGADTPASRIFLTKAGGTGSGFNRRIERVVCMISNRTETSSDMTPSADQAFA